MYIAEESKNHALNDSSSSAASPFKSQDGSHSSPPLADDVQTITYVKANDGFWAM
jgi:hypothetical protein